MRWHDGDTDFWCGGELAPHVTTGRVTAAAIDSGSVIDRCDKVWELRLGDRVYSNWHGLDSGAICMVGTYHIEYDDGDRERGVVRDRIVFISRPDVVEVEVEELGEVDVEPAFTVSQFSRGMELVTSEVSVSDPEAGELTGFEIEIKQS